MLSILAAQSLCAMQTAPDPLRTLSLKQLEHRVRQNDVKLKYSRITNELCKKNSNQICHTAILCVTAGAVIIYASTQVAVSTLNDTYQG